MTLISFLLFSSIAMAADSSFQLPTADQVVAKMMARDNERQATLHGYTASRRYVLENHHFDKRSGILVRVRADQDGTKHFEVVSEEGWKAVGAAADAIARGESPPAKTW